MGELAGLVARWLHLASSVFLVGGAALLLIASPSRRPTARRWEAWMLTACRVLVLVALGSAVGTVAYQTVVLEGRATAALEPASILRLMDRVQWYLGWTRPSEKWNTSLE